MLRNFHHVSKIFNNFVTCRFFFSAWATAEGLDSWSFISYTHTHTCYSLMPSLWATKCSFLLLVCVPACLEMQKEQGWIRTHDPTSHWQPKAPCSCHWATEARSFPSSLQRRRVWSTFTGVCVLLVFEPWTRLDTEPQHWHLKAKERARASTCCLCVYKLVECRFSFIHAKLDFCVLLVLYEFQNGMHCCSFKWLAAMYI